MRITTVALLLVVVLSASASAEVIRVVPLNVSDSAVFNCGDRCKFRGTLPKEALRVRIIRGTVAELSAVTNDRRYTAAGCIELYSTVIRPRRSQRTTDLLDLKFYFNEDWLADNGRNGQFVFIVERDDDPNGPNIEETSMLRLPAGAEGAKYFRAGVDVSVRAPVHVPARGGFFDWLFGRSATASASPSPAATAMTMSLAGGGEPMSLGESALPAAAPRAVSAECVDVKIDQQPIIFRRADGPPRKAPVHVAVR